MKNKKPIKVILYRRPELEKNAASFNRNEMLEAMFCSSFPCVVIRPKSKWKLSDNRYQRGIKLRLHSYFQIFNLYSIVRDKKYNYVLFIFPLDPFTSDPIIDFFIYIISRLLKIKLIAERNEFPYVLFNGALNYKRFLYRTFLLPWHYRLYDSLYVITEELRRFYGKYTRKDSLIHKLPMTVDFNRFKQCDEVSTEQYIFYAGSLLERKDGVVSLIKAFSKVIIKFPELLLKIAGKSQGHVEESKLLNLISALDLTDKVKLLGNVERQEIPVLMCSAKVLVLARPNSLQAKGGFPTKLGEYLATGRPVIVSKVGEIPALLEPDEVFFIDPDNLVDDLVVQLEYILSNFSEALKIAEKGKRKAFQLFSLEANMNSIKTGIESLKW